MTKVLAYLKNTKKGEIKKPQRSGFTQDKPFIKCSKQKVLKVPLMFVNANSTPKRVILKVL